MLLPLRGSLAPLTLAGKAPSSLLNGLISYWNLDEASGSRVDQVGGNTLTDVNTVTQATGKVGNAGQFTAASQERLTGADASLVFSAVDFSVSVWVWADTLSGANATVGRGIVSVHNSDAVGDWHLSVESSGPVQFSHWKSSGSDTTGRHRTSGNVVTLSAWFHLVGRRTSGVYEIWVNGSSASLAADSATGSGLGTTDLNVGRAFAAAAASWNGRIDELGIWNRSLTDAEIASLYNGGSGVTYPFS